MAMVSLSTFRPRVAMLAPTATDPMVDQAVLDACIDFCERTLVVKRQLSVFPTVPLTAAYTPVPPTDQSIAHFMRVWADETELAPVDEDSVGVYGFVADLLAVTETEGRPRWFNETNPGAIQLSPRPDKVYQINARVALRPLRTATTVDDQLFNDHAEAITSGALMRLFLVPGDLLNAPLAKAHAGNFEQHVHAAMLQARKGRTRSQMAVTPVRI